LRATRGSWKTDVCYRRIPRRWGFKDRNGPERVTAITIFSGRRGYSTGPWM
jgi:hypothetical protein